MEPTASSTMMSESTRSGVEANKRLRRVFLTSVCPA